MKIELSKFEVELLDRSLDAYESEPVTTGFSISILTSMLGRQRTAEEVKRDALDQRDSAQKECGKRRLQAALLRAKLLQALAVDSEHCVEENPLTPPRLKVNEYTRN
jgi:hypothetical protein